MPNAHVLGLGQSGLAAAKLLKAKGWQVKVSDEGSSTNLIRMQEQLAVEGISVNLGQKLHWNQFNINGDRPHLLIVSPGIAWDHPALQKAREMRIETIGEVELAWRYLSDRPWVGITGTNGKTTTTAITAAIFQAAGYHAPACGNIGVPTCELALMAQPPDWAIAEISSYQIESSPHVQPRIGIWTTFTPDHLSRHYTIESYSNIKAHLMHQSRQVILNGDDPYLAKHGAKLFPEAIWTSCTTKLTAATDSGAYIHDNQLMFAGESVLPIACFRLLGDHNRQNLLMAVAAAKLAGIESKFIERAVSEFNGVPHRLEQIRNYRGIDFVNDSKATNYDAAVVGLKSTVSPTVLIAGGQAKQGNADEWLALIKQKAIATLLIGEAAPKFAHLLDEANYSSYEIVETLEAAIPRASHLAQTFAAKTVLFSPACASFDQYANFEQRGDHFRQLCLNLEATS